MSNRTFTEALKDHDKLPHRDKHRIGFFNEMVRLASSYDECDKVIGRAGAALKVVKQMLKKMAESATTFKQWYHIHGLTLNNDPLHQTALNKMGHLADCPEDWEIVYENSPSGTALNDKAKRSKRSYAIK